MRRKCNGIVRSGHVNHFFKYLASYCEIDSWEMFSRKFLPGELPHTFKVDPIEALVLIFSYSLQIPMVAFQLHQHILIFY